ncbi:hypothetical protein ZIOFF_049516 [Zingiber officinale]|uniref:Pentatricopeptide repeat-containing protein n=1 Tax=Zingiber officinale TaxID=94328 RepID=A0A8J5FVB0_ZINOF|nr:hypothetical protein ZIOFF_049516 [Zingiber officinale]
MAASFSNLLSLLHKAAAASQVLQIHAQLVAASLVHRPSVASRLLYAVCELPGAAFPARIPPSYADLVFSHIPRPNAFAWNNIIRFHARSSSPIKALLTFARMRQNRVLADHYTYPFVLKACSVVPRLDEGGSVHGSALKEGFAEDSFVVNGLINFYCKRGEIASARKLFDGSRFKDLVSWNSLMAGYVDRGDASEARKLFDAMPERDAFSWTILIDGYGKKVGDVGRARELFDEMPNKDVACWNSMIDGYVGGGMIGPARQLFDEMPQRNVVSWSILIHGYVRCGYPKQALELFQRMLVEGIRTDQVCAVGAISACSQLGALDQGRWIHSYLKKNTGLLDVVTETAKAERGDMEREHGCAHTGLVDEGRCIFERMRSDFGIEPKAEHYGCLVDLLGRAGLLQEARRVIETMPTEPTASIWGSLLAACRVHQCTELAEAAVEQLRKVGADDGGVYVLISNIYAAEGKWNEASLIRRLMSCRGMEKVIGRSAVEVDGCVHEFVNGDTSHPCKAQVYAVLCELSRAMLPKR